MAAVCARPDPLPDRTSSMTPPPHLSLNTKTPSSAPSQQKAVPNKHIPYCSPGPQPSARQLETPPASPPSPSHLIESSSLLFPPKAFAKVSDEPTVYGIAAAKLVEAIEHLASQPLPSPQQVFPWLHGLHPDNHAQLSFFTARKKSCRRTPKCIRGLTVVKAGGDLSHSRLRGAIAPEEILQGCLAPLDPKLDDRGDFLEVDIREGFHVRNFQIQACKMATVSDIVVYGDALTPREDVVKLAKRISKAQACWQKKTDPTAQLERAFNTFILTDDYALVECDYPDVVAVDHEGCMTGGSVDFFHCERIEMCTMAAPAEISHNVWLGPTPDPNLTSALSASFNPNQPDFDLMIEASDIAQLPDARAFKVLETLLERGIPTEAGENAIPQLEFPGSGAILPPTWSQAEVDGLVDTCAWIHRQAHFNSSTCKRRDSKLSLSPELDRDGDTTMQSSEPFHLPGRKILIHCTDGYTETSLIALAYYMYAECVPVHDAWLQMHCLKGRNFFAYASDVALLRAIQPRLLQASPKHSGEIRSLCPPVPAWLDRMDGSLPSRIMPYMYLGNLSHANNPELLRELGISQVLSVGEPVSWSAEALTQWPAENLMLVDKVQDNGVDPLTQEFERCLEFIENGKKKGTATLVHCRVGVSRSATICIAEVMNELGLSFPRAYCFVRARRLNVIIQPHLRFSYELLKWEELQCRRRGKPLRRELEWPAIAREIAAMNKPYSRQN